MGGSEANGRTADHDVHEMFLARWSPRAFTGEPMPEPLLMSLFEAARWAPSAFNGQPWRFVYAHKGTDAWDRLFDVLIPYNQAWVKHASVLMYVISDRFRRVEGREPALVHSHSFDAGAAWACLALQANHIGWAAHGMAGFGLAPRLRGAGCARGAVPGRSGDRRGAARGQGDPGGALPVARGAQFA